MKIAVLYTCFNRKEKTLSSIGALYESLSLYNKVGNNIIETEVFLTDDGCTDGTSDAIRETFPNKPIHILHGTGMLYWAGGMRLAWKKAFERHNEWDAYLLLNDDTDLFDDCISILMNTHQFSLDNYNREGVYSGVTCANSDPNVITYGGDKYTNKLLGKYYRVKPIGIPQMVDMCNANILWVSKKVVDEIGMFYDGYIHGYADNDYGIQARKHDIPVLITGKICGACEHDHDDVTQFRQRIINMSLAERKKYFNHPLHSNKDSLTFTKRSTPLKYPMAIVFRFLNIYCPNLYFGINKLRSK